MSVVYSYMNQPIILNQDDYIHIRNSVLKKLENNVFISDDVIYQYFQTVVLKLKRPKDMNELIQDTILNLFIYFDLERQNEANNKILFSRQIHPFGSEVKIKMKNNLYFDSSNRF